MAKSFWLRGGGDGVIGFEPSPHEYHPPGTIEMFRSGRLTHPLAERIRDMEIGDEIVIDPRKEVAFQTAPGRELFQIGLDAIAPNHVLEWWECAADMNLHIKRVAQPNLGPALPPHPRQDLPQDARYAGASFQFARSDAARASLL